ncbi:hypothetical protein BDW71DRAFT_169927 [Aspergillus fruticulosus]
MQMDAPATREVLVIDTAKYHTYLADQNNILSSGFAAAYLSSIFSRPKTLRLSSSTITIERRGRVSYRETGVYPTTPLNLLESQEFIVSAFETILIVLTASGSGSKHRG